MVYVGQLDTPPPAPHSAIEVTFSNFRGALTLSSSSLGFAADSRLFGGAEEEGKAPQRDYWIERDYYSAPVGAEKDLW